jgi:hypothetical protein
MNISLYSNVIFSTLTKYLISKINISLFYIIHTHVRAHICFILYIRERYDFFVCDIDISHEKVAMVTYAFFLKYSFSR